MLPVWWRTDDIQDGRHRVTPPGLSVREAGRSWRRPHVSEHAYAPACAVTEEMCAFLLHCYERGSDDKGERRGDMDLHGTTDKAGGDDVAIDRHFVRLQRACAEGTVRLAGPATDGAFGIVIFEAVDETAARAFAADDPAVLAGVMTAELHPFHVSMEYLPCA